MRFTRYILAALFACAPPAIARAQAATPELPRATVSTVMPVTTRVLTVSAGGNLQAALDTAKGGDAIELVCGATYTGNFTLPVKTGTGWIVLRPACGARLPAAGTRLTPAIATTLALPKVLAPNSSPAVLAVSGAHHYRLTGLEVSATPDRTTNYGLVALGVSEASLADVPHDFVLDRVYVHGTSTLSVRRCVLLNSIATAVVDSYLSECHAAGSDAQAIAGWGGPGPFLIENNYLEGSGENIMFGGADPVITGVVPSDITIRHNLIAKPPAWQGGPWSIKNLLELKAGQRVLIEGNVFDGSWTNAQTGYAVLMKSSNQSGRCTWCVTQDVTFRLNMIRHVGAGIGIAAHPDPYLAVAAARISVTDNLITQINTPAFPGEGRGFLITGNLADVTIARNTLDSPTLVFMFAGANGDTLTRFNVLDNITGGGSYGAGGDGNGGSLWWARYVASGAMTGNVIAMVDPGTTYPPGNLFPKSMELIGFVDRVGGDYHLSAASAYRTASSTGSAPGANIDALLAATAGVEAGALPVPTPTPTPTPLPSLTLAQIRAALTALDKAIGPTGRESKAIKAALVPVDTYLNALLLAVPQSPSSTKVQP